MQTSQFQIVPPADYAGPRFVTDTRDAVGQFPDLFDSLEHQRRLTEIAESRRRSNRHWLVIYTFVLTILAGLVGWVAMIEAAK